MRCLLPPRGGDAAKGAASSSFTPHNGTCIRSLTVPSVGQPLRAPVPGVKARREVPAPPDVPPGVEVPPGVLLPLRAPADAGVSIVARARPSSTWYSVM